MTRADGELERDYLPVRTPRGTLIFLPPSPDCTPTARALVHELLWRIPSDLFETPEKPR